MIFGLGKNEFVGPAMHVTGSRSDDEFKAIDAQPGINDPPEDNISEKPQSASI